MPVLYADLARRDAQARKKFTYLLDDSAHDTWRSHKDAVLLNRNWRGDCDDLTSTVLDLLADDGVPLDRRYRLLVSSTRNGVVDHLIGCVLADDKRYYIVGDTFGPIYPVTQKLHQYLYYHRLDEYKRIRPGAEPTPVWRHAAPWIGL